MSAIITNLPLALNKSQYSLLNREQQKLYKLIAHGFYVKINDDVEAHAIIGGNRQGKSSLVAQLITQWFDMRTNKVVVLNSSGPRAFADYDYHENPEFFKTRWHGVIRYHNPAGYKETLKDVYQAVTEKYLYNGCVVFDDATKYLGDTPPQSIKDFLVDRRMYGLQLIFTTHMLRSYTKFCRGMSNTITVFKTAEVFESLNDMKQLEYPNYPQLFEAWQTVKNIPDVEGKQIQEYRTIETGI